MKHVYIVTVQEYFESACMVGVYSELDRAYEAFREVENHCANNMGDFYYSIVKAPIDIPLDANRIDTLGLSEDMEVIADGYKEDTEDTEDEDDDNEDERLWPDCLLKK